MSGGELLPCSMFIPDDQAPFIAGPKLPGMFLIFDCQNMPRRLGLQRMFLPVQDGTLACDPPQLVRAQPDFPVRGPRHSHTSYRAVLLRACQHAAVDPQLSRAARYKAGQKPRMIGAQ